MTSYRLRSLLVVLCVAAFVTAGCGNGSPLSSAGSPGSIIGPTALTADGELDAAATSSSSDTFDALGKGGEKGKDEEKDRGKSDDDDDDAADADDDEARHPNKGDHGSLSGFVSDVTPTTITVRGVIVTVSTDTVIRHGHTVLTMANIQIGDKVQVKGTTTTTPSGTTFTATEIKVEDMDHAGEGEDDDDAKVEGVISGLTNTPGCPSVTFNVVTTVGTTSVTTNASTKFDGVLCSTLADAQSVEVKGTLQPDGSIVATKVEVEDDADGDDAADAEVEGKISALAGTTTCPALTFDVVSGTTTVTTTTVTTNNLTEFDDVLCTALANDQVVEVKGTTQTDGSILATKIELED
jgi:cytochrome c-type biogenesis protein CcmE